MLSRRILWNYFLLDVSLASSYSQQFWGCIKKHTKRQVKKCSQKFKGCIKIWCLSPLFGYCSLLFNFSISFYLTEMLNPEVSSQPFYFPGNMFKNTHPLLPHTLWELQTLKISRSGKPLIQLCRQSTIMLVPSEKADGRIKPWPVRSLNLMWPGLKKTVLASFFVFRMKNLEKKEEEYYLSRHTILTKLSW